MVNIGQLQGPVVRRPLAIALVLLAVVLAPAVTAAANDVATNSAGLADGPAPTTAGTVARADGTAAAADASVVASGGTAVASGARQGAVESVILERKAVDRTPGRPGSVRVDVTYELPSNVGELIVRSRSLQYDAVTLAASPGFERRSDGSFEWDGDTVDPTLTFRFDVPETFAPGSLGVERDEWAFVTLPDPAVSWRYRGSAPAFRSVQSTATDGYATSAYALDGAASVTTRTAGATTLSVVVAGSAAARESADAYATLYRVGARELEAGFAYEESGLFVLPTEAVDDDHALGITTQSSVWVQDESSALDGVENTPAHEFVHTRMGSFGDGDAKWLTEASAEYYGYVLAMNTDHGTWDEFQASLSVEREELRDATLTDPSTWDGNAVQRVPYEKGALVLAALDAQISDRTGGVKSLEDVFAYRFDDDEYGDLETYENFSAAVVAVTNDPSMRDWLERYVAGSDTPRVPEDTAGFVLNKSMDSDGDGVANGEEVSTNPFDADTDGDGVDDGDDPYPTDGSRSQEATATATTTTASATATSGASAGTPTEAESGGSGEDGAETTTVESADGEGSSTDAGGGAVPEDVVPGFGIAHAVVAVAIATALATAVAVPRRE